MQRAPVHLPSLAMFLISGLGLLLYLSAAIGLISFALFAFVMGDSLDQQVLPMLSFALGAAFLSLLLIPSLVMAFTRLLNLRLPLNLAAPFSWKGSNWLMPVWLLLVVLGVWISRWDGVKWLLLPPIQLLAAVFPLWWLVNTAQRYVSHKLSPEQQWGLVSFGLVLGVPLVIAVEFIVLALVGILALGWLASQPEWMSQLTIIVEHLSELDPQTIQQPEIILETLRPLLVHPATIVLMLMVTVLLIPMVEELLKPMALWILIRREWTPAMGFAGGLLCGAIFALVETLGSLAAPSGDSWWILVLGRFGTGTLHTTTTALIGWAMASMRGKHGIRKLVQVYWIAVAFHGLWNIFGLLVGLVELMSSEAGESAFLSLMLLLGRIAPLALGMLMLVLLVLLIGSSGKVGKESAPPSTG